MEVRAASLLLIPCLCVRPIGSPSSKRAELYQWGIWSSQLGAQIGKRGFSCLPFICSVRKYKPQKMAWRLGIGLGNLSSKVDSAIGSSSPMPSASLACAVQEALFSGLSRFAADSQHLQGHTVSWSDKKHTEAWDEGGWELTGSL